MSRAMKAFSVFSVLFVPIVSSANFTGEWKGLGTFKIDGEKLSCNLDFEFVETVSTIEIIKADANCEGEEFWAYLAESEVRNGKIWVDGVAVGTISFERLFIDFGMIYGETETFLVKRNSGDKISVRYYYYEPGESEGELTGSLQKQ
ncbi:MAG: hypothetical protein KDD25_03895 [Bdellovibrionales bacterium]|nr:hypothetical protein [Bdellovibrionales bacterium]